MNKYDFGYQIIEGTTIEWAYHKIKEKTVVLELGPANGNLAKHLLEQKGCIVDIVEIDEEAGKQAAQFARNSCIGSQEGDLQQEKWIKKLKDERYDYIVILDVLEHLNSPEKVLKNLGSVLKENGSILLSIPNIAHNSVLLELMQNHFDYTDVGLLDSTHVKFFTYTSAQNMIHSSGYVIAEEEVKEIEVGKNEIPVLYESVPREVQAFLKTRQMGEAYQFLFILQKETKKENSHLLEKIYSQKKYQFNAFHKDKLIFCANINPLQEINLIIPLPEHEDEIELRVDPLDTSCILSEIDIGGEGGECAILQYTGIDISSQIIFFDDDPQIYIKVSEQCKAIIFKCIVQEFDSDVLLKIAEMRDYIRGIRIQCQEQYQAVEAEKVKVLECNKNIAIKETEIEEKEKELINCQKQLNSVIDSLNRITDELNTTTDKLNATTNELSAKNKELAKIKNCFIYKLWMKVRKVKVR